MQLESAEDLSDFSCEKCSKKNINKRTRINLISEIFIVHINRFSVTHGIAKKELPTQKILRTFENYELVGMIFHIGKNVECGHYVYNWKKGPKRWVEFNDLQVF